MPRKKLVEHNALVQAIEMSTSKQELMEKFGYKSPSALKVAYVNALIALNKVSSVNKERVVKKVDSVHPEIGKLGRDQGARKN